MSPLQLSPWALSRPRAVSPGVTHGVGAGGAEHGAGGAEQAEQLVAAPLLRALVPPCKEEMQGQEGTGDSLGDKGTSWGGCGTDRDRMRPQWLQGTPSHLGVWRKFLWQLLEGVIVF